MSNEYPHLVDLARSTIGSLKKNPPSVIFDGMEDRPDYTDIGNRLKAIRKGFSELTQKQWAEKHNFAQTQYNNWEKGSRRISVDAAELLADRYGLSLDFIYRGRVDGLSETARNVL